MLQFTGNSNDNLMHEIVHSVNDIFTADKLEFYISGMVSGIGYHAGMMRHP